MQLTLSTRIETRQLSTLKPHPRNEEIYGDSCDQDLIESVRRQGVTGIVILPDATILSGHRRVEAALAAELIECECIVRNDLEDEWDVLEALLDYNRQRDKTTEQRARELEAYLEVECERAKDRQRAAGGDRKSEKYKQKSLVKNFTPAINGKSREIAAAKVGLSHPTAKKARAVVKAADRLKQKGNSQEAKDLIDTLNKNVDKAHKLASDGGLLEEESAEKEAKVPAQIEKIELEDGRIGYISRTPGKTPFFNSTNEMVDWARWTWNPVTGCFHNCDYCYARDIAHRFYETKFEPTFHPERLLAPSHTKVPKDAETDVRCRNVFTCSMADLFGKWVPEDWIMQVFQSVIDNPQWNFLFLTKFPQRLQEINDKLNGFPDNAWVGTTVDEQQRVKVAEKAFSNIQAKVKWLSCEPLLQRLTFNSLEMFDWVVIGGQSASSQTQASQPEWEWVEHLWNQARVSNCKVYWKENLTVRPKECPW